LRRASGDRDRLPHDSRTAIWNLRGATSEVPKAAKKHKVV